MQTPEDSLPHPRQLVSPRARYWRMFRWTVAAAVLSVTAALVYLSSDGTPPSLAATIATIAGVGMSVLLAGSLMGLIFLSSGMGHDEEVAAFVPDQTQEGRP